MGATRAAIWAGGAELADGLKALFLRRRKQVEGGAEAGIEVAASEGFFEAARAGSPVQGWSEILDFVGVVEGATGLSMSGALVASVQQL